MRIKITKGGIHDSNGVEIAIGAELTVKAEPPGWAGRYEVIDGADTTKTAVVNPAKADPAKVELEAHTIPELKKLAEDEKIDLKSATAKGDIIALILAARQDA